MNTDKIFAENLANEYAPKSASKVIALKKLDRRAKLPSDIFGYSWGIIFCLIFGLGMCLAMLPVVGLTLPFLSCGGSSVLATYVLLSLVHSIKGHKPKSRRW